jgi:hypothetical protein
MTNLDLSNLSSEEIEQIELLLQKLKNKPKKSRKKPTQKSGDRPVKKRKSSRKKGKAPDADQPKRRGSRKSKTRSMAQNFDASGDRPNKFLGEGLEDLPPDQQVFWKTIKKKHKDDVAIDKKLSGKNEITPRSPTRLIEAECNECQYIWEVSPSLVYHDEEGMRFICEECQQKRIRG